MSHYYAQRMKRQKGMKQRYAVFFWNDDPHPVLVKDRLARKDANKYAAKANASLQVARRMLGTQEPVAPF